MRCSIWRRTLAKYRQRYPEAVRSLCEDEEHLLTFYAFPPVMHRYIRSTNAIESLGSQCAAAHRSDRRFHHRDELSDDRLGRHAGYSLAQDPGRLEAKEAVLRVDEQPPCSVGSGGGVLCQSP
jgi:hypothetical protein